MKRYGGMWKVSALCAAALCWAAAAGAVECRDVTWKGADYTVCEAAPQTDTIRLFLYNDDGAPFGHFLYLPRNVIWAMNAGMYHEDRAPVGHYIENGKQMMRVIPNAGPGNFGMLPNGVLCIRPDRVDVIETLRYQDQTPDCTYATQSGPMLVIDGDLHPRFIEGSDSLRVRNGVGTSAEGARVVFAISKQRVNFHDFATLFRDHLGVPQALYLDGGVSRLYDKATGHWDGGPRMGPIVAITN